MKEFEFIDKFLKPIAAKEAQQLADDCAYFDGYAITKDVLVEGVHFFKKDDAYNLARKALRVNLSDLAASGAKPFGFMLGLTLPKKTPEKWLEKFANGLESDIKKFKIKLLGGDTTSHDGGIMISITAIGEVPEPVMRGGAKIGDNIFVSGKIGKGWIGLQNKRKGKKSEHYELPEPRVDLVPTVRKLANSCIDISDGLLADLNHICEESKLGAEICSAKIPLADKKADLIHQLTGGDDYELCFTSKSTSIPGCYNIGKIVKGKAIKIDGKVIKPKGFEHY